MSVLAVYVFILCHGWIPHILLFFSSMYINILNLLKEETNSFKMLQSRKYNYVIWRTKVMFCTSFETIFFPQKWPIFEKISQFGDCYQSVFNTLLPMLSRFFSIVLLILIPFDNVKGFCVAFTVLEINGKRTTENHTLTQFYLGYLIFVFSNRD